MYKLKISTLLFIAFIFLSSKTYAADPFPSKSDGQGGFLSDLPLIEKGYSLIPMAYEIVIKLLTILLIGAVIWMAASFITKNTQWMQWSKTTLLTVFISLLIIRLTPLLFFTKDVMRIKLLINKSITLLTQIGIHAAIAMVLTGLFIHFMYVIHENPAHYKWARGLFFGSIPVLLLSLLLPNIIDIM